MTPDYGPCPCGALADTVVVTVGDWIYELCRDCAVALCDPIRSKMAE